MSEFASQFISTEEEKLKTLVHKEESKLKRYLDSKGKYAPTYLRIGLAAVWLWFGINQLIYPQEFLRWAPSFLDAKTVVFANGIFETTLGFFLLIGFFTRITAFILAVHLTAIVVFSVGYNAIGMRNVGLIIGNYIVFLDGHDQYALDSYLLQHVSPNTRFGRILKAWLL